MHTLEFKNYILEEKLSNEFKKAKQNFLDSQKSQKISAIFRLGLDI
jgi:hypothetical protein